MLEQFDKQSNEPRWKAKKQKLTPIIHKRVTLLQLTTIEDDLIDGPTVSKAELTNPILLVSMRTLPRGSSTTR